MRLRQASIHVGPLPNREQLQQRVLFATAADAASSVPHDSAPRCSDTTCRGCSLPRQLHAALTYSCAVAPQAFGHPRQLGGLQP